MKFQKAFFEFFFILIILATSGCLKEKESTHDNQDSVSLQKIGNSNGNILMRISNHTNKSIYLPYMPSSNDEATVFVFYRLLCEENKGVKNYGSTAHFVPTLEPLEKEKSFQFQVNSPPEASANCKVSILYYENKEIANLINIKNPDLSESEKMLVEEAKKFVEFTVETNDIP